MPQKVITVQATTPAKDEDDEVENVKELMDEIRRMLERDPGNAQLRTDLEKLELKLIALRLRKLKRELDRALRT
jgi:hypothetical protein